METLTQYRQLIRQILTEHCRIPYSYGEIKSVPIFDAEADHYLMMAIGWEEHKGVHDCMIHVDIINGKFWIQYDGTEYGVAQELLDADVPKDHIVLAFHSPETRQYTEFAAA
jgi:hypothetical protein